MDVIDRINALLKEKGLSGAELSRIIGVSTAVYSQWNRKVTKPSNKNIVRVAEALNVPVSYLTNEQEENPSVQDVEFFQLYQSLTEDHKKYLYGYMQRLLEEEREMDSEE